MTGLVMINSLIVIVAYVLVAAWAYRRGRRMLVKCALGFLVVLVVLAALLGLVLNVPSTANLVVYVLAQGAPIIIMPTWLLLLLYSNIDRKAGGNAIGPIPIAVAGAVVGFMIGYMITFLAFPAA